MFSSCVRLLAGRKGTFCAITALRFLSDLAEALLATGLGALVGYAVTHEYTAMTAVGVALVVAVLIRIAASVSGQVVETNTHIAIEMTHRRLMIRHVINRVITPGRSSFTQGDLLEIADEDSQRIADGFIALQSAIASLGVYIAAGCYLVAQSWMLGIVAVITIPVMCLALPRILDRLRDRTTEHRSSAGSVTSMSVDAATGQRVIKGIGGERTFLRAFADRSTRMRDAGLAVAGMRALIDGLREFVPALLLLLILTVSLIQWRQGVLSVAQIVSFYGLAAYLIQPVTERERPLAAAGAPEREVDNDNAGNDYRPSRIADGKSKVAATRGDYTVIVSDSLADLRAVAARLGGDTADEGTVADGVPYARYSTATLRRMALLLDTDARLVSGTVGEILGEDSESERRHDALHIAALDGELHAAADSDVLDFEVAEGGGNLSGGQRQRLLLAKAAAKDTPVLVLVEPTSEVDTVTEQRIITRLKHDRTDRITVVATRSPAHLRAADVIYWLHDGTTVMHGDYATLTANPSFMSWLRRFATA